MPGQRGMSFVEVVVAMAFVAIIATISVTAVVPWLGREEMRGAVYQVQQAMQLGRSQAIARNRDCRLLVDTTSGQVALIDLNDPLVLSDDIVLHTLTLPRGVTFSRPDAGLPVTLAAVGSGIYQATFSGDGSVTAGVGLVALEGGDGAYRINLYGAGGVRVERWDGSQWVVSS